MTYYRFKTREQLIEFAEIKAYHSTTSFLLHRRQTRNLTPCSMSTQNAYDVRDDLSVERAGDPGVREERDSPDSLRVPWHRRDGGGCGAGEECIQTHSQPRSLALSVGRSHTLIV